MAMKIALAAATAAACCAVSAAQAAPLSIVDVGFPAVNCVFNNTGAPNCTIVVDDSEAPFTPPGDTGDGRLQSRTWPPGIAGAPGAGLMAYLYRVDMGSAHGPNCVTKLALNFGPVVLLPYKPPGKASVFVGTTGTNSGTIGLASADQVGNAITFTFAHPVCPGAASFLFGLASRALAPRLIANGATLTYGRGGNGATAVRVP